MALRVLLGDESSTIKKVFQLALQDFAVEVRPVNLGVDVLTVAQSFKPDIIFVDVLLQKKSGYDVASELKAHAQMKDVPVVLMWSGFMELDEDKFEASMANAQLEKPFDVGALRKLVSELVPRTNSQRISQFLTFPKMPDLEEPAAPAAEPIESEEEDFKQVSIPKLKKAGDEKFRLNLEPADLDTNNVPVDFRAPVEEKPAAVAAKAAPPPPVPAPAPVREASAPEIEMEDLIDVPLEDDTPPAQIATTALSAEQLEKIIRDQSAEMIESVVWKVVPELAKQIIERELNKLLQEREY